MSGDTTIQALTRLTQMPDNENNPNAELIAGQKYYDVYFTGGAINGVALGNIPSINVTGAYSSTFLGLTVTTGYTSSLANAVAAKLTLGSLNTFTLNGSTPVVVSDTSISQNCVILITIRTVGGTQGAQPVVTAKSVGTSFTVVGTAGDTSTYVYKIIY